jgi:hypothetical protein
MVRYQSGPSEQGADLIPKQGRGTLLSVADARGQAETSRCNLFLHPPEMTQHVSGRYGVAIVSCVRIIWCILGDRISHLQANLGYLFKLLTWHGESQN